MSQTKTEAITNFVINKPFQERQPRSRGMGKGTVHKQTSMISLSDMHSNKQGPAYLRHTAVRGKTDLEPINTCLRPSHVCLHDTDYFDQSTK